MFLPGDAEFGFRFPGCSIWELVVEWVACSVYKEKIAAAGEVGLTLMYCKQHVLWTLSPARRSFKTIAKSPYWVTLWKRTSIRCPSSRLPVLLRTSRMSRITIKSAATTASQGF